MELRVRLGSILDDSQCEVVPYEVEGILLDTEKLVLSSHSCCITSLSFFYSSCSSCWVISALRVVMIVLLVWCYVYVLFLFTNGLLLLICSTSLTVYVVPHFRSHLSPHSFMATLSHALCAISVGLGCFHSWVVDVSTSALSPMIITLVSVHNYSGMMFAYYRLLW